MKKLKIGIAAVAAVVAGGLATSYVVGGKLQKGFEHAATEWSQPPLTIKVVNYQRGLFTSSAQTVWTVNTDQELLRFTAKHNIQHGPWSLGHAGEITTAFAWPDDTPPELVAAYKGKPPLLWHTQISWSKTLQNTMTSPEITASFDGNHINFGGFKASFEMPSDLTGIKGSASLPLLQFGDAENDALFTMQGVDTQFDGYQPQGYEFMVGSSSLSLTDLRFAPKSKNELFQVNNFTMNTDTVLTGEVLNSTVNTQVKSLVLPGYQASDIAMDLDLSNIDAASVDQLSKASKQAEGDPVQLGNMLMQNAAQFLAHQPAFAIKRISWRTDQGTGEISAQLAYQGDPNQAMNPATDIKASARLSLPTAMLRSLMDSSVRTSYHQRFNSMDEAQLGDMVEQNVTQRIDTLVQAGILVEQNNTMTGQFDWIDGQLQANGKALSTSTLLGIAAMQ